MKLKVLEYQKSKKPRYNSKDWVLCECTQCGRVNYVEPHGTTQKCRCSSIPTKHVNIPYRPGVDR